MILNLSKEIKGECLKLVKEKGVYPYEYMDSFKGFDEVKLPSTDKFYSSLRGGGINEGDYERAKNVWNSFEIKTLGEDHDLYLKTDVLLLCDILKSLLMFV